jgi:hypothetical protein
LLIVIFGFILGNYDSADQFKDLPEENYFFSSYTTGAIKDNDFVHHKYRFDNCYDDSLLFAETQYIGIIGIDDFLANSYLRPTINKHSKGKVSLKKFSSEEELISFAEDPSDGELCAGIKLERNGFDFEYTLYLDKSLFSNYDFSENVYDELAL